MDPEAQGCRLVPRLPQGPAGLGEPAARAGDPAGGDAHQEPGPPVLEPLDEPARLLNGALSRADPSLGQQRSDQDLVSPSLQIQELQAAELLHEGPRTALRGRRVQVHREPGQRDAAEGDHHLLLGLGAERQRFRLPLPGCRQIPLEPGQRGQAGLGFSQEEAVPGLPAQIAHLPIGAAGLSQAAHVGEQRPPAAQRESHPPLVPAAPVEVEGLFRLFPGSLQVALLLEDDREVAPGGRLSDRRAGGLVEGQGLLEAPAGSLQVPLVMEEAADSDEGASLSCRIPDLAGDLDGLPQKLPGLGDSPQPRCDAAEVLQGIQAAALVADLEVDGVRLFVLPHGAVDVALVHEQACRVVQGRGDSRFVSGRGEQPGRLCDAVQGLLVPAQVAQSTGLEGPCLGDHQSGSARFALGGRPCSQLRLPGVVREDGARLGLGEVEPRILREEARQLPQPRQGVQCLLGMPGPDLHLGELQPVLEIVRKERPERPVNIDDPDPLLGGLGAQGLDQKALLARQGRRALEGLRGLALGVGVVSKIEPGAGERGMRQWEAGLLLDRAAQEVACLQAVQPAQRFQPLGVEAAGLAAGWEGGAGGPPVGRASGTELAAQVSSQALDQLEEPGLGAGPGDRKHLAGGRVDETQVDPHPAPGLLLQVEIRAEEHGVTAQEIADLRQALAREVVDVFESQVQPRAGDRLAGEDVERLAHGEIGGEQLREGCREPSGVLMAGQVVKTPDCHRAAKG